VLKEINMKIDFHNHYYPEEYLRYLKKKYSDVRVEKDSYGTVKATLYGTTIILLDPKERIGVMEEIGVDVQILSLSAPNVYFDDDENNLALARMTNDYLSQICCQHPDRFMSFASIPITNVDYALKELDRAINDLGMNGIILGTNVNGRYLDAKEFYPFFEEVNRMRLPIFIHPMDPPGAEAMHMHDYNLIALVGFPFDSTLTAARIVFSGMMDRFKRINFILSHMGGALPYLFERLDYGYRHMSACKENITNLPSQYFKRFYYETALSYHLPQMDCAIRSVGPDSILLGSDYPFVPPELGKKSIAIIDDLEISEEDREKIYTKNAKRILGLE